jgi:predicted transcriptional regulator
MAKRTLTRLYKLSWERDITATQLAQEATIERSRVARISSGQLQPTPDEKRRLAEALGESVQKVFPDWEEESDLTRIVKGAVVDFVNSKEGDLVVSRMCEIIGSRI